MSVIRHDRQLVRSKETQGGAQVVPEIIALSASRLVVQWLYEIADESRPARQDTSQSDVARSIVRDDALKSPASHKDGRSPRSRDRDAGNPHPFSQVSMRWLSLSMRLPTLLPQTS